MPSSPSLRPQLSRQASSHACRVPGHELVRRRVLAALTEGSTMRCPTCGRHGRKDSVAECSHIHCYCGTDWCYRCGRPEAELQGGFAGHNTGYTVLRDDRLCPLFLKQRYGIFFSAPDQLCAGEPDQALRFFHLERQLRLVEAVRRELADDALWTEAFERHFGCPPGTPADRAARALFDRDDLESLEELNDRVGRFVEAKSGGGNHRGGWYRSPGQIRRQQAQQPREQQPQGQQEQGGQARHHHPQPSSRFQGMAARLQNRVDKMKGYK